MPRYSSSLYPRFVKRFLRSPSGDSSSPVTSWGSVGIAEAVAGPVDDDPRALADGRVLADRLGIEACTAGGARYRSMVLDGVDTRIVPWHGRRRARG